MNSINERVISLQVQLIKYVKTSIWANSACTGTIISNSHILSAAHCFADVPDLDRVEVFMGSTVNVFSAPQPVNFIRRTVYKKDIIVHKDYNASDYVWSEIHLSLNCSKVKITDLRFATLYRRLPTSLFSDWRKKLISIHILIELVSPNWICQAVSMV